MNITQYDEGDVTIFTLEGRVDSDGVLIMQQTLQNAATDKKFKMIVEMSEVRYINSAGLRVMAEILAYNRENGGDLRLVALNPKVARVFEIIGFHKFFQKYDNILEALTNF